MNNYIGEFPTTIEKTPAEWAMEFIGSYGQIDGSHHKTWVLDQVARILHGTEVVTVMAKWGPSDRNPEGLEELRFWTAEEPSQAYKDWVEMMLMRDEAGEPQYSYDEGIAP
jgi:hypothetical protein